MREGEVNLSLDRPALFTVDINGQMEDQDTGWKPTGDHTGGFYDGPPIHTLTIFANPTLSKPSLSDPGVHQVTPGQEVPLKVPGTLYFLYLLTGLVLDFLMIGQQELLHTGGGRGVRDFFQGSGGR